MTIEAWNLLLNGTIAVLLICYGVWLKNVVDQQLKAKDATIETLKAAISSDEAEIARLKSDTAPAIVAAYQAMRLHADQMTKDSLSLRRDFEVVAAEKQSAEKRFTLERTMGRGDGMMFATNQLMAAFKPFFAVGVGAHNLPELVSSLQDATLAVMAKASSMSAFG
jgi:hypothetical protein